MSDAVFSFGANWQAFLRTVDESSVQSAAQTLSSMLGNIASKTFLDIGCGSGLLSLAAHRLGAIVHSFDYDPKCIECTLALQNRFGVSWPVEQGSALDSAYMSRLGQFDIVYSWGVLHHTGNMWQAFENVIPLAKRKLWIAIYNDQGWRSRYWYAVKRIYNSGIVGRSTMVAAHLPYVGVRLASRALRGRLSLDRGMSLWYDYIDWLGGYPFEVATPADVQAFFEQRGFALEKLVNIHPRHGCNEFVFTKPETES